MERGHPDSRPNRLFGQETSSVPEESRDRNMTGSVDSLEDDFIFGIEIELVLKPRSAEIHKDFRNIVEKDPDFYVDTTLENVIKAALRKEGIPVLMKALDENSREKYDYSKWIVEPDGSIEPPDGYHQGFELVSPVLEIGPDSVQHVSLVFGALQKYFEPPKTDASCGFHIHVSPAGGWRLEHLKQLSKAIVCLDPLIDALLPTDRQGRMAIWSEANVLNKNISPLFPAMRLLGTGYKYIFDKIDEFHTINDLKLFMSPSKYSAWNFRNLRENGLGTVEFRRPPGITNTREADYWIAFVLGFFRAGTSNSCYKKFLRPCENDPQVPEFGVLQSFVSEGSWNNSIPPDCFASLFEGRSYRADMTWKDSFYADETVENSAPDDPMDIDNEEEEDNDHASGRFIKFQRFSQSERASRPSSPHGHDGDPPDGRMAWISKDGHFINSKTGASFAYDPRSYMFYSPSENSYYDPERNKIFGCSMISGKTQEFYVKEDLN